MLYDFEEEEEEGRKARMVRVGSVKTTLGRLVSVGTAYMPIDDNQREGDGLLKVKVFFVSSPWDFRRVEFTISARDLDRKDLGGISTQPTTKKRRLQT